MTVYADYNYYVNSYGGKSVSEDDFAALAAKASAQIDKLTSGRAAEHAADERLQNCCCEMCEALQGFDSSGAVVQSETVGSWSRSYGNVGNISESKCAQNICARWLPADWLYRGVARE